MLPVDFNHFNITTKSRKLVLISQKNFVISFIVQKKKHAFLQREWGKILNKLSLIKVWKHIPKSELAPWLIYSTSSRPSDRTFRWLAMWKVKVDDLFIFCLISIFLLDTIAIGIPQFFPSAFLSWLCIFQNVVQGQKLYSLYFKQGRIHHFREARKNFSLYS